MSEEKKYDSILVGWVDDPNYTEDGQLMNWRVKLKEHELQEMLDKYLTTKTERGGGNVYLTLFVSKSGRSCCRVYDPNSEGAKKARTEKANVADDLPF
tara:strand:+ start:3396 stop:3689 length:294 start_codon:yes stop_codon:yes gene_type:complete